MRLALIYILAAFFLVAGCNPSDGADPTAVPIFVNPPTEAPRAMENVVAEMERAMVVNVIDGDTLDTSRGRVRLVGVDTPERGQRCAVEATDRLRALAGDTVRLEDGPRLIGPFGRRLAYVYTEDGASIDEALIRDGLATAWTRDGQHRGYLVGLEREAQMRGTGCLW